MQKLKTFWILLLILIIAGFMRLNQLQTTPPGLYPDEAMNGSNILESLYNKDYKVFYPENNGREGLFMNIQAQFVKVLGHESPWILRLPSALFGILTVLGLYFLGKELFSKKIGLISSFLLATSLWHTIFSRIGFRAIMAPFFLVWGLYLLVLSLKEQGGLKVALAAIAGGFLYGLGFYSYIAYRVTPIVILGVIAYFLWRHRSKAIMPSALFLVATFITALPIGLYFLENPQDFMGRTSQISIFNSGHMLRDLTANTIKTLGMFNFIGDNNWRHNYAGSPQLFWPVGIAFIIGTIYGLISFFKGKERLAYGIIFGTFIFGLLPIVISNEGLPHALRAIMLIPPVFLLAAVGVERIYEYSKKYIHQRTRTTVFAFLAILVAVNGYYSYFIAWGKNPNLQWAFNADLTEIANKINALPDETPKYVIVRGLPAQPIMFLTGTYVPEEQKRKNIFYVLPENEGQIPEGAIKFRASD